MSKLFCSLSIFCLIFVQYISADTPANCTYEDIRGTWVFAESARTADRTEKCDSSHKSVKNVKIVLSYPDVAVDEFGNKGNWTIIYNQGFEVTVNYRRYFAFSAYEETGGEVVSYCHKTLPGWSHDVLGNNWACYTGQKQNANTAPKVHKIVAEPEGVFIQSTEAINKINSNQKLWTARYYPEFEGKSLSFMNLMKGGPNSRISNRPSPAPVSDSLRELAAKLPDSFDWRNVSGVNYVTPVRNQGGCGSCFAFAAVGMIESRIKVHSKNTENLIISPQEVVSCSEYAQGCQGGFPYLVAGKYGQDFGLVEESCYPYEGRTGTCKKTTCKRHYTAQYNYIGGYYGACNEEAMRVALVNGGPIAVGFEVYSDFQSYSGGIYTHTHVDVTHDGSNENFSPFAITNHAVLVVGYGTDQKSGQKYWSVKNSWGASWGEKGYFRISRGNNECNIETIALEASAIP